MAITHDYHIHTHLSLCSNDPKQNPDSIAAFAKAHGYDSICITDHCWDARVAGASEFYAPQGLDRILATKPLPQPKGVRVYLGCESEYLGGEKLALTKAGFDVLDHVNIPLTHFHMYGFVRPVEVTAPEQYARLLESRLEELLALPLPFEKIGIAHITDTFQSAVRPEWEATLSALDHGRLRKAFAKLAKLGGAVELNPSCFPENWQADEALWLGVYKDAYEEGCRWYFGSDAHHPEALNRYATTEAVVSALGLTEAGRYRIKEA